VKNNIIVALVPSDPLSFLEKDLHLYCKMQMPEYMRPDILWQLESFPLTSSGKPDRVKLREMFLDKH
jgi:acyl-CoA synthetase (AMP-forming)/AMP-acid ligase II